MFSQAATAFDRETILNNPGVFILVGSLLIVSLVLLAVVCYLDAKQTAAFADELLEDDEIKFIRMLTEVEDYNIHLTNLIKLAEAKGLDYQTEIELTRTFEQITSLARRAGEAAAKQGGGSLNAAREEKYASIVEGRAG